MEQTAHDVIVKKTLPLKYDNYKKFTQKFQSNFGYLRSKNTISKATGRHKRPLRNGKI
ncbi:MAG: hypothetical protein HC913_15825 [Microscillaceae bacterium]|nr:hypothetical protein [Microscillaceae bacterium]